LRRFANFHEESRARDTDLEARELNSGPNF
jgi:hypothetical protein